MPTHSVRSLDFEVLERREVLAAAGLVQGPGWLNFDADRPSSLQDTHELVEPVAKRARQVIDSVRDGGREDVRSSARLSADAVVDLFGGILDMIEDIFSQLPFRQRGEELTADLTGDGAAAGTANYAERGGQRRLAADVDGLEPDTAIQFALRREGEADIDLGLPVNVNAQGAAQLELSDDSTLPDFQAGDQIVVKDVTNPSQPQVVLAGELREQRAAGRLEREPLQAVLADGEASATEHDIELGEQQAHSFYAGQLQDELAVRLSSWRLV